MELKSITVQNYRSIIAARKIPLGRMTALVGPNNEGKSNILRALVLAMDLLSYERRRPPASLERSGKRRYVRGIYSWERDYPIHLQEKNVNGSSIIVLDFKLTSDELQEFRETIRSNLSGSLPVKVTVGATHYQINVHKKGPGAQILSRKSPQIAAFIARKIELQHIPAIRTARQSQETVGQMLERALLTLDDDPEYQQALTRIGELQRPLLDSLSSEVQQTLVQFLPNVNDVKFDIPFEARSYAVRRSCQITVDDGTPTLLQYKGDGIQSLVALGLARHVMERSQSSSRNLVIAIEEPESHLHPDAIHELRDVLWTMSQSHQVVLTTHNPLFVDRVRVNSNILVHDKKARPAQNIEEVRIILGVRSADNLRNADLVLVVEGDEDKKCLIPTLAHSSKKLEKALQNKTLGVTSLLGSGNLSYQLSQLRDAICLYHCLLDDDDAGHRAFERAKAGGLVDEASCNFTTCDGRSEAEFEDWISPDIYREYLSNRFRVALSSSKFRSSKKWSRRMHETFKQHGKRWTDAVEAEIKTNIAGLVQLSPGDAVLATCQPAFKALVEQLEQRLEEIQQSRKAA